MKKVYLIWALLLIGAILFSCAKETLVDKDAIAGEATASITGDGSDNGDESGANEGGEAGPEDGEGTTPAEKPEFIDNNDWSAYDENEYLIGFGAVDENSPEDAKATIDLSDRTVAWKSDDRATVYVPATGARRTYAYDATRKQFRPASPNDIVAIGNNLAYVYYPASIFSSYSEGTATVTMPGPVAVGNVTDLGDKLPMAGIIPANQGKPYPTVTFRNLGSVLRVQLTGCETITSVTLSNTGVALAGDNAGSVTWSDETAAAVPTLAMSGDTKSVTVSCGEGGLTLNESTPTEFYFLLPSSGTMSSMKVRVNFSQYDGTYYYTPYIEKTRSSGLALSSYRSKVIKLAFRAGFFSGGNGTSDAPYQIATSTDLQNLATYCASNDAQYGYNGTPARNYFRSTSRYVQTANIDMDGVATQPIGLDGKPFLGYYNGGNYNISNLSLSSSTLLNMGLFGRCKGGTIQNVKLVNAEINDTSEDSNAVAGGIVGYMFDNGSVTNCFAKSCSVTAYKAGGILGCGATATVSSCEAWGVTVTGTTTCTGGIVGMLTQGSITSCKTLGANGGDGTPSAISASTLAGGIVGTMGDVNTATLSECYVSNTNVTVTGNYAGGVAGRVHTHGTIIGRTISTTVSNNYGTPTVSANRYAGGVAGINKGSIQGSEKEGATPSLHALSHYVTVNATTQFAGGLVGTNEGSIENGLSNGASVTAPSDVGGLVGINKADILHCLCTKGTITAVNSSSEYGNNVGGLVGSQTSSGSIDLSDICYQSSYNNTVEGNSYVGGLCGYQEGTITGHATTAVCGKLTLTAHSSGLGGVSGHCLGNISSCKVGVGDNNVLSGTGVIGGIAGEAAASLEISNCSVTKTNFSSSASNSITGGLVGRISNAVTISGSSVNTLSFASSGNYYGGLVASVKGASASATISACSVTDLTVNGAGSYVGGVVGYVFTSCSIDLLNTPCSTINFTNAAGYTGGVVGFVKGAASISGCNVTALNIGSSGNCVGGILGRVGDDEMVGTASISNCTVSGSIVSTGSYIGGVLGYASNNVKNYDYLSIYKCCNEASVGGNQYVGGIVGNMNDGNIEKCRNKASVTASGTYAGGIVGVMYGGTIQTCYAAARDVNSEETCIQGAYFVGGLAGAMYCSKSKGVLVNCAARTHVTSTSNNGSSTYNCYTGGLVGYLYVANNYYAFVYNSVAFERLIQNTSLDEAINIAGVVGMVSAASADLASHSVIRNCYAQVMNSNLKYQNGSPCPTIEGKKYGGIFGHLQRGMVYDCYYRCDAAGVINTGASYGSDTDNYTQITGEAKNGTEKIAKALTLHNTRTVSAGDKFLVDVLRMGSYSGGTGTTPVSVQLSDNRYSVDFSRWETYKAGEYLFAVPKVLRDEGEDYYKN